MLNTILALLGSFGSIGSIITGIQAYKNSREVLSFHRDDLFGKYNKLYGPLFHETPDKSHIYLTFSLFNERKKILIKKLEALIFFPGNQEWIACRVLSERPSSVNYKEIFSPTEFPKGYINLGKLNKREIPEKSAKDYFLALECRGFPIHDPEGNINNIMEDEFTSYVNLDLKINIETSTGKKFIFQTLIWIQDPLKVDKTTITEV